MSHNHPNGQVDDMDESLWDSPATAHQDGGKLPNTNKSTYQELQEREESLKQELHSVRQVNEAIEGVIQSLGKAKDNMKVCEKPIDLHSWD